MLVLVCTYGLCSTCEVVASLMSGLECIVLEGKIIFQLVVANTSIVDGWSAPCPRGKASMAWWLALRLVTRASVKGKHGCRRGFVGNGADVLTLLPR